MGFFFFFLKKKIIKFFKDLGMGIFTNFIKLRPTSRFLTIFFLKKKDEHFENFDSI
jgi:hypothetical protein